MKGQDYPFRSEVPLSFMFKLEVWYDGELNKTRFRVCQRVRDVGTGKLLGYNKSNPLEGEWFVRAEFQFVSDLQTYLKNLELSDC